MAAGFSGCGQKSSVPDTLLRTAIAVSQKGAVTVYLVEDFEKDYYSLQELQEMAEGEVTEFYEENPSEEEKAVVLESVEETGENRVKLIYQYADWTAYEKSMKMFSFMERWRKQKVREFPRKYTSGCIGRKGKNTGRTGKGKKGKTSGDGCECGYLR